MLTDTYNDVMDTKSAYPDLPLPVISSIYLQGAGNVYKAVNVVLKADKPGQATIEPWAVLYRISPTLCKSMYAYFQNILPFEISRDQRLESHQQSL